MQHNDYTWWMLNNMLLQVCFIFNVGFPFRVQQELRPYLHSDSPNMTLLKKVFLFLL